LLSRNEKSQRSDRKIGQKESRVKNLVLHVVLLVVTLACIGSVEAQTVVIGQCPLPTWADGATTKLGWVFSNPQDPGGTAPLTGWDIYVGDPPSPAWDYDAARLAWGAPGQWYIQIPNTEIPTGIKRYWLCFVYERDPFYGGTYLFRNMSWTPFDSEQNLSMYEEWFDAAGFPTGTTHDSVLARMHLTADMYPGPQYEEIWLGVVGGGTSTDGDSVWELLEVYFMALPLPSELFADGFESGTTSAWSNTVP
jgi:hypothetical protein